VKLGDAGDDAADPCCGCWVQGYTLAGFSSTARAGQPSIQADCKSPKQPKEFYTAERLKKTSKSKNGGDDGREAGLDGY